ncbi:MAG: response regulator, partial [Anaerolineae bacterium]
AFDKVKAFEVGGVDYVTKPFQAEEVLARVATHLALRALQIRLEDANARLEEQNRELQARNEALQQALDAIKTLSGLIPICAWCGSKIKDDAGQWVQVEVYIKDHSDADFTHGICPACLERVKGQR